jgi:hypothetical protein
MKKVTIDMVLSLPVMFLLVIPVLITLLDIVA